MAEKPQSPPELGMSYEGIDHIAMIAAPDAAEEFERLGFLLSPSYRLGGTGIERRSILTGTRAQPFGISLDVVIDEAEAAHSPLGHLALHAPGPRGPVYALALRVSDLGQSLQSLEQKGVHAKTEGVTVHGGSKLFDLAVLPDREEAYAPIVLVQYALPASEWFTDSMLDHALSLKRLDHLAATTPRQDEAKRYWENVLGIPQTGELTGGSGNFIRQFQIGTAIVELIGAATPSSPARTRPPGMSSMTAFEVPDLDAAVRVARAAGFTISDPAKGPLPGTNVSRIPAEELAGLGLQLLQYV
jgi:catechol 2,3-dioxygenase-like lactoylglutathione lyase family enzyme